MTQKHIFLLITRMRRSEKGVTLLELLIYMGIFATLLMVLVELFGNIVNVSLKTQAVSAVSQDGRYILNRFTYDIRQATTIAIPASGSSGSTLQFTKGDGKTYTYSLVAGANGEDDLDLSDGINTAVVNGYGTTVSSISFTHLATTGTSGLQTITISLTLKGRIKDQQGYEQKTFTTTVGIR